MSLLASILTPERRGIEVGPRPLTSASLLEVFGGAPTSTGKRVSEEGALRVGTVLACVMVIAESIASLPLPLYRRLEPRGKERASEHPLYQILHDRPNPWMTSYTLREMLQGHLLLWGNAFAEIVRDERGRVLGLFPLRPDCMDRPQLSASGELLYTYHVKGAARTLPQASVLHLRGLSSDGLWGYSPIALQREALGLALTAEEFQGRFFSNNAQPGGILSTDKTLSPEAAAKLKAAWNTAHGGLTNAYRVAVLEEGLKWQAMGMPLQDAQFLQLRQYQRSEICGWFRVPPHLIADVDRSTSWGSGIEQQNVGFVTYTLRPWLVNWEQALGMALLTDAERRQYFPEHILDAFLRGDASARGAFYKTLWEIGAFSPNDIREKENLNPVTDGDLYFVPLNYAPLDQIGELFLPESVPMPGPRPGSLVGGDEEEDEEEDEQKALPAPLESRALDHRLRLREAYRPLLADLIERTLEVEGPAILEQAKQHLGTRAAPEFLGWLERFESDEVSPRLVRLALPLLAAYGAAVEREVLDELDLPSLTELLEPFVRAYAESLAKTYTQKSLGQMRAVLSKAAEQGADPLEAVQARLAEWNQTRAGKVSEIETVRAGEAAAHHTYKRAGVTRLRWRASGKNCPWCSRMNGKVVGIEQHFADKGDELDGGESQQPLKIRRRTRHAPLHRACDCAVAKA
jgi:HK97 family phage portal protein